MPITVKLPSGQTASFPDGMSPDDIQKAIESDPNSGAQPQASQPGILQRGANAITDLVKGAEKGAASTFLNLAQGGNSLREWGHQHLPAWTTGQNVMPTDDAANRQFVTGLQQRTVPNNTFQSIGKAGEQIGEFLLPGGAEEKGAAKLAELAPKLGKYAKPLAKVLTSGLSAGTINAAQGGSPITGALMGAGGTAVGELAKAAAPAITEFAQGISTPGRRTGKAILAETKGVPPGSIRRSAQSVLDVLNPRLNAVTKAASVRPNPVRALLPAPATEIPLAGAENFIRDTPGELIAAAPFPRGNIVGGSSPRVSAELGSTGVTIPPRLTRDDLFMHSGVRPPTELPTSGPGVLIRPFKGGSGAIPSTIPNASMSLGPARNVLQDYANSADEKNLKKLIKGTKNLWDQINIRASTGEVIPENVTPWAGLQIKRGVGEAVSPTKWRPGYKDPFIAAQKGVYGRLADAFHAAVPEAASLDTRISNLIPASKPGKISFSRYVSPAVGTMMGGYTGTMRGMESGENGPDIGKAITGGLVGATMGGLTGYAAPTAMNAFSRGASSALMPPVVRALTGAGLQFDRKSAAANPPKR